MRVAEHLFELGLAHILAVVGLLASIFVWRGTEIGKTFSRLQQARNARRSGANPLGWYDRNTWVSLSQLGLWSLALVGCIAVIYAMFNFLSLMATLYEIADRTDFTLLEILGRRAYYIRDNIVISGLVISGLFVVEWIVGLLLEAAPSTASLSTAEHLFCIPEEWRDAPAEMWRERLLEKYPSSVSAPDDWRKEWGAWIKMVGAVRDAQEHETCGPGAPSSLVGLRRPTSFPAITS